MRIGSLFSGYGGLDMAVRAVLGGTVAWYSEIEPAACRVLEAHLPGVPNLGDVTTVDWSAVEPVDVLTGGYPCQPFSHAGKRKGTNDERHLWPYVRDALAALRPMVTVLENVDGHRSLGLADVLGDIADLGMCARWGVVRASDAGAPHGRKRVFIVAYPSRQPGAEGPRRDSGQSGVPGPDRGGHCDAADAAGIGSRPLWTGDRASLRADGTGRDCERAAADAISQRHDGSRIRRSEEPTHSGWTDVARSAAPTADADSERHGGRQGPRVVEGVGSATEVSRWQASTAWPEPGAGGDIAPADADHSADDWQRPCAESGSRGQVNIATADADGPGSQARINAGSDSRRLRVEPMGSAAPTADADCGPAVGKLSSRISEERLAPSLDMPVMWGKYAAAISRWERTLSRPAPAPTIPGNNGRPRLSPVFVEWMMGLPEGHVTGHGLSNAQALKMLGNGVVPQQAALALHLLGVAA